MLTQIKFMIVTRKLDKSRVTMEGELVVVKPCGFLVVVEDDPEERMFLESAQSGI